MGSLGWGSWGRRQGVGSSHFLLCPHPATVSFVCRRAPALLPLWTAVPRARRLSHLVASLSRPAARLVPFSGLLEQHLPSSKQWLPLLHQPAGLGREHFRCLHHLPVQPERWGHGLLPQLPVSPLIAWCGFLGAPLWVLQTLLCTDAFYWLP